MTGALENHKFTAADRSLTKEDRIVLTSVGIDIGSSTTQLLFSRLELEREDTHYVTTKREVLYNSEVLLTPYRDSTTIDGQALGRFFSQQYKAAGVDRTTVDTGALILTGTALQRRNAKAIAELFAEDTGRFVAVSAGDNLEATMAAHGSGAVAYSETGGPVMNIDIGGGTTKVAICRNGRCTELMALDIGARLVIFDDDGSITHLEECAYDIGRRTGIDLSLGRRLSEDDRQRIASYLVDQLVREVTGCGATHSPLLRTDPLSHNSGIRAVILSGGVAEFVHGRAGQTFGDLGAQLGQVIRARQTDFGAPVLKTTGGVGATVVGASQYTIQLSGSTIFVSPLHVVPLRNVPVIRIAALFDTGDLQPSKVADDIRHALHRLDLEDVGTPVAVATHWTGSATYERLSAFSVGVMEAMGPRVDQGQPLILIFDRDVGGLLGRHFRNEHWEIPIISIDGVEVRELDYVDIGELIPTSGTVPVVIKSLLFSTTRT